MKRHKTYAYVLLVLLFTGIGSCKHEVPKPANNVPGNPDNPVNPNQPCDPNTVYFERDVLPILVSNCAMDGCHSANNPQDGVRLTDFNSVRNTADVRPGDPEGSDLYEVLVEDKPGKRMPYGRPPLPNDQIEIIRKWIQQGAQNLGCNENPGGCDTTAVSFSAVVQPILQKNCTGCHSNTLQSGNVNLSAYAGAAATARNGKLVGVVSHAPGFVPMPQGGSKLSDCDIARISAWVNAGAPNN